MKEKNTYKKISAFIFYLISSYGVIALSGLNLLIHINFFELIKGKGIGLLIVSFLPAIAILVLGVIELWRGQGLKVEFRIPKFYFLCLTSILVIALSLTGAIITAIFAKSWALENYILWISLFILGLNRLVLVIINRIPQWMIMGVIIVLLNGLFYCISGAVFLVTGLALLILGINDLRIINLRISGETLIQWIFFTFLLSIGLFIISFGIQESKIRVEWGTILFGIGIIPISILFFFITEKLKGQKVKKTKTNLTFRLILQILSFILIGLAAYVTISGPILTHIYYEILQGIESWEMVGSIALVTSILGSISLLLGAMIGIKTYKSSLGIFIFGLLGIIYIYLIIINLDALFLLVLPLFICLLSIFVFVKKEGIKLLKLRGKYPVAFILTSFVGIIIITLIIQYHEFKTMNDVTENIIKKISNQGPNVSRITRCKMMLEKYKAFSQNLLFKPYTEKLNQKIAKLDKYVNKYLLEVKSGKYPSYYIGVVRDKRFTHEEIRRLKNLLDKFTFEYEWMAKLGDKKVLLTIHGVTDTLSNDIKEQFGDDYVNLLDYPKLKEGKYPEQPDEIIINSLTGYFDKSKHHSHFYCKKDDLIVLSCKDEKVGEEMILLGKRYKIVGISDKLTNYRDVYLPYFEAKRLTQEINLTNYNITEQDTVFAILNTDKEMQKIKISLKEMDLPYFDGMID